MTIRTPFTDLVGCRHPLQNAGMGAMSPALGIAVARAGALGMLSGVLLPAPVLKELLAPLRSALPGKLGINFLMPFLEDPAVVDIAAEAVDVVEFFYADPDASLVRRVHEGGALAAWQVGSLDEALAAVDAGCDFIIAQGVEAGGHVRGTTALLPLLNQVLGRVNIPVLAAGGIGDGRGIAAVLAVGAAGARLGTRFVAAPECGYHPRYVEAILAARASDTEYTECFSGMWAAPHRVLRSCIEAAEAFEGELVGQMQIGPQRVDVPRFSVMAPVASATGAVEAMALYAGQSVEFIHSVQPAGELVRDLMAGAEQQLAADCRRMESWLGGSTDI